MATSLQPARSAITPAVPRDARRSLLIVVLAIGLPLLAGIAWHFASDNPAWPLFRNSLQSCELHEAQVSPVSPDGLHRAHIVYATFLGRFTETLVYVTPADASWSLASIDANKAVLEAAGMRSLDAVDWQNTADGIPALQLWFVPSAYPTQVHRIERSSGDVIIKTLTSTPAPGAERLAY